MFQYFLILTFKNLRHRQLRSFLTIIGIIIGIAAVIAVLFLGNSLENSVKKLLNRFGGDLVIVIPGEVTNPMARLIGEARFKPKEVESLKDVQGVDLIFPSVEIKSSTVEFFGEEKSVNLHIAPWEGMKKIFEESQGFRLEKGTWPIKEITKEVILGKKIAQKGFKSEVDVDDEIIIKGRKFRVAGIFAEMGEPIHDNSIFISPKTYEDLTGEKLEYLLITIKVLPDFDLARVAADVEYTLKKQKGITEFSVLTSDKAARIAGSIIGVIELALTLLASVALIVGGIGIMNTMYTSVLERTSEIGVMKALGGKTKNILLIFVLEAGIIGAAGGVIGIFLGAILAKLVETVAHSHGFVLLQVIFSWKTIVSIFLFSFLVGISAGFLPARTAARLKPVDALRYE